MGNFIGTYEVKMDTKGRVRLPSALLRQIAESSRREFVLNRGFEGCISLFPIEEWKNVSEVVNSLSPFMLMPIPLTFGRLLSIMK